MNHSWTISSGPWQFAGLDQVNHEVHAGKVGLVAVLDDKLGSHFGKRPEQS